MTAAKKQKAYYCHVELALDKIGGRWKPLILWHLRSGKLRFSELKRLIPNINEKMLTEKLRELESDELIGRKVYPEVPPRVEYSLTTHGKKLDELLTSLCNWGKDHARRNQIEISATRTLRKPKTDSTEG